MGKIVAEVVVDQLSLLGVKRIYGVVGDAIIGLLDALDKQEKIQFIPVKHESVAAFMASAEAKLTGRLAVCTATMGPGAANSIGCFCIMIKIGIGKKEVVWVMCGRYIFFFNDTATTEIYTLSLHDALPILKRVKNDDEIRAGLITDRKSTRLNSSH